MRSSLLAAALVAFPSVASAADPFEPLPPAVAADFVDHEGHNRFFLNTRWALGEQDSAWAYEFSFAFQLARGIALTGVIPVGLDVPREGASLKNRETQFFMGNATLGIEGGGEIGLSSNWEDLGPPTLHLAGGLDLHGPTAPERDQRCTLASIPCDGVVELQKLRSIAPGLYLNRTAGFRARFHLGFDVYRFAAALELGVTPAWPLEKGTSAYVFVGLGARLRYVITDWLEPFVELGTNTLVVAPDANRFAEGPLYVTPGIRFHAGPASPSVFVSIAVGGDPVAPIIFGLELAGIMRRAMREQVPHSEFLESGI